MYICQLDKKEKLWWYKAIKAKLIADGVYSYENIRLAMNSKVKDLEEGLV